MEFVDVDTSVNVGQDPEMFEKELNEPAGIKIRNLRKVSFVLLNLSITGIVILKLYYKHYFSQGAS